MDGVTSENIKKICDKKYFAETRGKQPMAKKVSFQDVSPALEYEPGFENRQGINDSTTDTRCRPGYR